jgi:NADPH2:quinone reductase
LRFLVDADLPRSATSLLRRHGHDVIDVRDVGLVAATGYQKEDFVARVMEITGGKGADGIYDSVGGDVFEKSIRCIAWSGRLLVIGFASGVIPSVQANRILLKNIAVTGLHWGAHAAKDAAKIPRTFEALFELQRAGSIRPVVFASYPLDEVPAALEALGSRRTFGKVIVAP